MNRNKLHGLRERTAADSLIGELLDALLDDGPAAEAAAVQVDAGAVSWSSMGLSWRSAGGRLPKRGSCCERLPSVLSKWPKMARIAPKRPNSQNATL